MGYGMISPINGISNIYVNKAKKQSFKEALPVEEEKREVYADPSAAIKSQLGVKTPISYTFIRDIEMPYAEPAKLYKLANGQKVAILHKKGPAVVKSYYNVGALNEPEGEKGISHFIEHMKFNGSENLNSGEFFNTVNKIGAATNAGTGLSMTDYFVAGQMLGDNDLETTIRIHADMLQAPSHTPEMVEKEKGPVLSEISMCMDHPENLAMNNCIKNLFGIKTGVKDLVAGSANTVGNLSSEKVKAYDETWYTPDNCITVITGNVDPQKTIELVAKYFNKSNDKNVQQNRLYTELTPITAPVRQDITMPKAQNSIIMLGFAGPQNNEAKDKVVQTLLLDILFDVNSSRITDALDKIHASASVTAERIGNRPEDPTFLAFTTRTTPDKVEEVLKTYYNAIQEVKSKPITQSELDSEKKAYKMSLSLMSESSYSLNSFIGGGIMDGDFDYPQNILQILDSITTDDLNNYMKKYLDLNKVSLSLVHPENTTQEELSKYHKNASAVSFKGQINQEAVDVSKIKQYRLGNNINAVFNPNHSELADYTLSLYTSTPPVIKPGTQMLLSALLKEGSAFRNANSFYKNSQKEGIYLTFKADSREISVDCISTADSVEKSLKYLKETLLHPRFTQERLDYVKANLKEKLKNISPSTGDLLSSELFPNISDFASREKIEEAIDGITLSDVMGLYQYIIQNAKADFVMTAPVEKNPLLINNTLTELSKDLPVFKQQNDTELFRVYTPIKENKLLTKSDKRIQAEIEQMYTFKQNKNPKDRLSFLLLNYILGGSSSSRLFSDLREKQLLAYKVNSTFDTYCDMGIISLYINTTTDDPENNYVRYDNVQKSLDGFKKHVNLLKTETVPEDELNAAKLRLKTTLLNDLESSSGQTASLLSDMSSIYSINNTNELIKLIDEITPQDIYNTANYVFSGNALTSIIASENTLKNMNTGINAAVV